MKFSHMNHGKMVTHQIPASLENIIHSYICEVWEGAISSVTAICCFTTEQDIL
ncbi:hypothetical protein E2C01_001824 [Portunus trituberculatus]|uniref:Uncharacterized protein n=1 Tax=Portunus trituberculatus TaxID=210409 RepID=A0A5B7CHP5_PORTR|nr:hypothetical protein [Portunus trituberculatus]